MRQRFQHRGAGVPCHVRAGRRDVVPAFGTGGDHELRRHVELRQERAILLFDERERLLPVVHEVHFVDHHGDLFHAQHREQQAVPFGLIPDAFHRIDQQEGGFGPRRAGDHVLQKFLVPGRVDDDVLTARPLEEGAGGIDGHALLLLFQERVEQEGVFKLLALLLADGLDFFDLAFRQGARVRIEAPQQRRLAVVHAAHDDDVHAVADIDGGRCVGLTCSHLCGVTPCPGLRPARGRRVRPRSWRAIRR